MITQIKLQITQMTAKLSLRGNGKAEATNEAKWEAISKRDCHASPSVRLAMTFLFVLASILLFTRPSLAQTIDRIVAIVNDEIITQTDVDRVLATIAAEYRSVYSDPKEYAQKLKQVKKNIINQMVDEKLILSEAKKFDINIEEEVIEDRIEQIKKDFPNEEDFEQALETQDVTLKDLRDRFRNQEIMKKAVDYFVRFEIKIDPIEIKQFYQSHQQEFLHPEEVHVKSIFIRVNESGDEYEAEDMAKMVIERLREGDGFEDLAKSYSQGASAEDGGDLGFIEKGQLIKEIDEVIFSLQPAEFSDVIKVPSGYRIFKIEEKRPQKQLSFSEVQDSIEDILYRKKFAEFFRSWIEELKQNAYIQIKEETFNEKK